MKKFAPLAFAILIFFILAHLSIAMAQTPLTTSSARSSELSGSAWGLRAESEFKSTRDKKKVMDGYESQTDLRIYREINSAWSGLLGTRINQQDRRQEKQGLSADEGVIGLRSVFFPGDLKIKTEWTYNSMLNEKSRLEEEHDGFFQADVRTSFLLGFWGKARLRFKHWEFLANKQKDGVELRQTKLEFSPGYFFRQALVGLRHQFIAHGLYEKNTMSFEIGPFIRYKTSRFEPVAKVIYRPVNNSPGLKLAGNWEYEPVYCLELNLEL